MVTFKWHIMLVKMVSLGKHSRLSLTQPRDLLVLPTNNGKLEEWVFSSVGATHPCLICIFSTLT